MKSASWRARMKPIWMSRARLRAARRRASI
jgi:hypothetical protein